MRVFLVITIFVNFEILFGAEQVVRAFINNENIQKFNLYLYENSNIDVWLSSRLIRTFLNETYNNNDQKYVYFTEFRIKNSQVLKELEEKFNNIKYEILIEDLFGQMNKQKTKRSIKSKFNKQIVGKFASYGQINSWLLNLAKSDSDLVHLRKIGSTFEKRNIFVLKITNNLKRKDPKPLFLFDGGIHAREWLSVSTIIFMIDRLVKQYRENDHGVMKILNNFEIHFIPLINPDGYEYSRSSKLNRFWRKNMRVSVNGLDRSCYGIDLNRNFDHKWMVSGASANPCSEVYAGRYPASENEVKAMQDYIMSKSPQWLSHISLHSFGAVWISPFSYSRVRIQDNFEQTCQKAMSAISKVEELHKFKYRFGVAAHELYEASGCTEDWSKDVAKVNHTFVVELKPDIDSHEYGFDFPEDKIEEASLEAYDGFIEYIKTFLNFQIDKKIIDECKNQLNFLKESVQQKLKKN
ncbi:unnamed protein product [Brachionus calyciflorus]|uniref:Peptidase M14 domain-containing protein n=1 Tax=Brachionus calyciflorus TaxID=104777 RepID=A0A814HRS4_9BILA|nr:unnamed protein product [Brachionus calyciflorus]